MPQMNVQAGTTFTDIYARFQPTGTKSDDKNVRFEGAKGLYTSQKASTAQLSAFFGSNRLAERAQKRQDGAQEIRNAISREHPALAQRIFQKLGQDHPHIDFGTSVRRGDLDLIKNTIDQVVLDNQHLEKTAPASLQLAPDAKDPSRLSGDSQGAYSTASRTTVAHYLDGSLADLSDPQKYKQVQQPGFPAVMEQFTLDVGRSEIRLGGNLLQAKGGEDPRTALGRFTGDDAITLNLSKMLTQQMTTALNVGARDTLLSTDGSKLMPRLGGPLSGAAKDQFISVTKQGDDFVIDYEVHSRLNGFAAGMQSLSTDPDASSIRMTMQLTISAEDLAVGNLGAYTVTRPPAFALHAEIDGAALARQR